MYFNLIHITHYQVTRSIPQSTLYLLHICYIFSLNLSDKQVTLNAIFISHKKHHQKCLKGLQLFNSIL